MEPPASTVLTLLQDNWNPLLQDPSQAEVGFFKTYFDPSGKIRTWQVSALDSSERLANLAMGTRPKYEGRPEVAIHVWAAVLPVKGIEAAVRTRRNMLDEIIRIIQAGALGVGGLAFIGNSIFITHRDELGQPGTDPLAKRLHSIMLVSLTYHKM